MIKENNEKTYRFFCQNVKTVLKERQIVYKEICENLEISEYNFCNKLNNRKTKFNLWQMIQLSKYLGISIEDLSYDWRLAE